MKNVRLLKADREFDFRTGADGRVHVAVPQLDHYEIVLFEYESWTRSIKNKWSCSRQTNEPYRLLDGSGYNRIFIYLLNEFKNKSRTLQN